MAVFFLYIALPVCDNRGWRMIWVTVNTCFPSNFFFFCSAMTSGSGGCFGEPVLSRNGKKMGSVLKTDSVRFFMGPLSCRRALSVYVIACRRRPGGRQRKKKDLVFVCRPASSYFVFAVLFLQSLYLPCCPATSPALSVACWWLRWSPCHTVRLPVYHRSTPKSNIDT
jgi:hypothetical protein